MRIISSGTRTIFQATTDLVEIVYYDHAHVTVADVQEDLKLYDVLVPKNRVKKLIVMGRYTTIDIEARKKAAEENRKRKSRIIAEAVVARSTTIRLAVSMYMLFLNKEFPVKVFSSIEKAREWLLSVDN